MCRQRVVHRRRDQATAEQGRIFEKSNHSAICSSPSVRVPPMVRSLDHGAIIAARNRPTNVLLQAQGKVPTAGRGARRHMGERFTLTQCVRPRHCLMRVKSTDDPERHRLILFWALPLSSAALWLVIRGDCERRHRDDRRARTWIAVGEPSCTVLSYPIAGAQGHKRVQRNRLWGSVLVAHHDCCGRRCC
jgi:hypothetical protein